MFGKGVHKVHNIWLQKLCTTKIAMGLVLWKEEVLYQYDYIILKLKEEMVSKEIRNEVSAYDLADELSWR